ncbi:MAG: MMPL family transporter [Planctomycetes bacterium]|nr:MMPL family transporter [Planctomycetota bacterium]
MDQDDLRPRLPEANGSDASERPLSRVYAIAVLAAMLLSIPAIGIGVVGALKSNSNDPRQWLPRGFPETDKYEWFQDQFGRDEIAVVSWPDCTLDDPRVDRLADVLTGVGETDGSSGDELFFERATTGPKTLAQLTSGPLRLSRTQAIGRLRGTLVGADGRTTCAVLVVSARGEANRAAAVDAIYRVAKAECGLDAESLFLGGPTVDAATIDVESQRMLLEFAAISAVIALAVSWWRLRSARLAVLLLLGAVYSTGVALAVLYYSGGTMNLLMTMLPPLIYVLTISAAVHLVNYYRDAIAEVGLMAAPRRAVRHGWGPCVLAATTTAIGLVSLSVSKIVPIRSFGIYSAVGMVGSLGVVFLFFPAALTLFPLGRVTGGSEGASAARASARSQRTILAMTMGIRRFHALVMVASLLLMVALGGGLFRLQSTVKLQHRFAPESDIIADYTWLEDHLGPLIPLEIVIHFDRACTLSFLERMELVAEVEAEVTKNEEVGATMSALDFAPALPKGRRTRDIVRRSVFNRRLQKSRQRYVDAHFLAENGEEQLWRVSVRARALSDVDYGHFVATLREHVDPVLEAESARGVKATYTGVIPLIYKAQRQLFRDLIRSFLTAFFVIALVMVVVLRSVRAGLLAMLPNVFPAVVVFGFMGWWGLLIEIGSVMTASAALGIAVDDTFHFLAWFRRGVDEGMPRHKALHHAYRRCARAMISTTVICGAGLIVFSLSTFMPIVHFAWLMVTLLAAALLGDLVFLPAMLAGPLGTVFGGKRKGG